MAPRAPRLVITCGELAGIGPELILKAWWRRKEENLTPFSVLGPVSVFKKLIHELDMPISVQPIDANEEIESLFQTALPVIDLPVSHPVSAGTPDRANAHVVIRAITKAAEMVLAGEYAGMVTAPIQKSALYDDGFLFPGHTEYLGKLCADQTGEAEQPVMMLACPELRVVPVTIHIPLEKVPHNLSCKEIVDVAKITAQALNKDFGIAQPRLAIAALNPHAGEDGNMGNEEALYIRPAIDQLNAEGIMATGPHAADTLFHDNARRDYDAAICMYHDQALIPLKTIDFYGGGNVTLGLPIIRTSPDHGTALGIAGRGIAEPRSMIEAIKVAGRMAQYRHQNSQS